MWELNKTVHKDNFNNAINFRDHPFNFKGWGGGGGRVFLGKTFSVSKFDGKNVSVSDMDRKKYSEKINL